VNFGRLWSAGITITALNVSAKAKGGIIEAVEYPWKKFVLGVQWHPEGTWEEDPYSRKLFRAFVQKAHSRQKK
jgi:putative glutamine amidotransferase